MKSIAAIDDASDVITLDYLDKQTLVAYKTADQSVQNSTTLVNDTHLSLTAMEVSTRYAVDALLLVTGTSSAAADLKLNFNLPTSATIRGLFLGPVIAATALTNMTPNWTQFDGSADQTLGTISSVTAPMSFRGILVMSSSTGTFGLKWAQNTANNTTATALLTGSWLRLRKLG